MTEPLLRRLQARGERITVGALPWVAPVYRAMPQVAEVVELPFAHGGLQLRERRQMARTLKGRFDVAYVCPNSLKSALLPLWAGIAKRVGYKGEGRIGLLTHRLPNPRKGERPPMVAFYSALSGDADVQADQPRLSVPPGLVADTLAWAKLQPQGFYVLAPGAEYGDAKRWPAEHFGQLAAQLDAPAVLLGSGKEAALTAQIAAQANAQQPGQVRDWAGRTTLDQALALIAAARAVVSNDSGLMHVAAALGVPQVAIFGSSSPLHTPPLSARAQVLWLKNDPHYLPALDCAPCFERSCPLGHTRCLRDITPQRVLQAL